MMCECNWCNKGYRFEFNWIDDEGSTITTKDNMVISGVADYCPNCGRPLAEPKPLTLEELKAREGKPVWVVNYNYFYKGSYVIVVDVHMSLENAVTVVGKLDNDTINTVKVVFGWSKFFDHEPHEVK